jgi:hypothetical protein
MNDAIRQQPARSDDQATEHNEHYWRVSLDAPGRRVRRTPDMDWCTPLYHAYFPHNEQRVIRFQRELERRLDDYLAGTGDLPPRDPVSSASVSDHLRPDADKDPRAAASHADPGEDDVLPGRPVCPPGWVNLSRHGTRPYCHPAPDLSGVHHATRAGRDVSGQVWQGGSAHAHATAGDFDGDTAWTTLGRLT